MNNGLSSVRLGIICGVPGARDAQGRVACNHAMGRLIDALRSMWPGAKLCMPLLHDRLYAMNHVLSFPAEDIVSLPPLESVIKAQRHFIRTRNVLRRFARSVDLLFIRVPFQIPSALLGLSTPKLVHVVSNPNDIILASSDYRGLMRRLALGFAAHSTNAMRKMIAEPMTRAATNGQEMWEMLHCREGRVVVSSCIYEREMQPRRDLALTSPPKLLFVGYIRPEKGVCHLLQAFESLRKTRPLKLTLVGGRDRNTNAEAQLYNRICNSPYRDDITLTGMVDFGEPLFELYRSHDIFVLPSLSEGTPRTLVEARSFGCPVVATSVGGIPSSVEDGRTGLLVEPGNTRGLAAAIERILTDNTLRVSLIEEGVRGASKFSLEYFASQLTEELRTLARHAGLASDRRFDVGDLTSPPIIGR